MSIVNSATTVNGTTTLSLQTTGVTAATIDGSQKLSVVNDATINGVIVGVGSNAVSGNTALGNGALSNASLSGANNTGLGYLAGYNNTSGASNTFVGNYTGVFNTTGAHNVALGYSSYASVATATGSYNVSLGSLALNNNTTGANNISIGYQSLAANTTGASNVAIGSQTLGLNTASNNTAVGYQAGFSNTTGAGNFFAGYQAGYTNSQGNYNTIIGLQAGYNLNNSVSSGSNTFIGANAGLSVTSGTNNTFVGCLTSTATASAGSLVTTGSFNTILGAFPGNGGGLDIRTASNYIVLSDGAGTPRVVADGSGNVYTSDGTTTFSTTTWPNLTAFASKSFAANGYQKLPSGMIIQWGVSSATTNTVAVTFPVAFPNAVARVLQQDFANAAPTTSLSVWQIGSLTTSGFTAKNIATLTQSQTTVGAPTNSGCAWIAFGY